MLNLYSIEQSLNIILPFNIEKSTEIEIESVSFDALGVRFFGEGTLGWNVKDGFHLNTRVTPNKKIKAGRRSLGGAKVIPNKILKFKINKMWNAYTIASFSEFKEIFLLTSGKISLNFYNLILYSDAVFVKKSNIVKGKCYYKINKGAHFPDKVVRETKLLDEVISSESKLEGLLINDEFINIRAFINDYDILEFSWEIDCNLVSKRAQWDLSIAIRDALSICFGQSVTILRRDIYRNNKSIIEIFKEKEVINLGYFSPLMQQIVLDKTMFLTLLKSLVYTNKNSNIIRNLFYQMADAMRVNNFTVWQFMLSSALEATLRTYYNKPFQQVKKNDSFKGIEYHLKEFKREYFENDYLDDWRKVFKFVHKYYKYLRHINSHPDWIKSSDADADQKRLEAMTYLSKFYGFVILALAGYKNLKPEILIQFSTARYKNGIKSDCKRTL